MYAIHESLQRGRAIRSRSATRMGSRERRGDPYHGRKKARALGYCYAERLPTATPRAPQGTEDSGRAPARREDLPRAGGGGIRAGTRDSGALPGCPAHRSALSLEHPAIAQGSKRRRRLEQDEEEGARARYEKGRFLPPVLPQL